MNYELLILKGLYFIISIKTFYSLILCKFVMCAYINFTSNRHSQGFDITDHMHGFTFSQLILFTNWLRIEDLTTIYNNFSHFGDITISIRGRTIVTAGVSRINIMEAQVFVIYANGSER